MAKQAYDLLVIGAGAAGSAAVSSVDKHKLRVGLVERNTLGGTCLNYGCDPTKTMIHVAQLLYAAQHANRFGLRIPQATFEWHAERLLIAIGCETTIPPVEGLKEAGLITNVQKG